MSLPVLIRPPRVVAQALDQLTHLVPLRGDLATAAAVDLAELERWDERIAAQIDVIALAGGDGAQALWKRCARAADPGQAAALVAVPAAAGDGVAVGRALAALLAAEPEAEHFRVVRGALVLAPTVRAWLSELTRHADARIRRLALGVCSGHLLLPDLGAALRDEQPAVRARAIRLAAELGQPCDQERTALLASSPATAAAAAWAVALRGCRMEAQAMAALAAATAPWWAVLLALVHAAPGRLGRGQRGPGRAAPRRCAHRCLCRRSRRPRGRTARLAHRRRHHRRRGFPRTRAGGAAPAAGAAAGAAALAARGAGRRGGRGGAAAGRAPGVRGLAPWLRSRRDGAAHRRRRRRPPRRAADRRHQRRGGGLTDGR
jgi:hypothetical protein